MDTKTQKNCCPVCGQGTKEDEIIIYCDNCGFNINKDKKEIEPKSC